MYIIHTHIWSSTAAGLAEADHEAAVLLVADLRPQLKGPVESKCTRQPEELQMWMTEGAYNKVIENRGCLQQGPFVNSLAPRALQIRLAPAIDDAAETSRKGLSGVNLDKHSKRSSDTTASSERCHFGGGWGMWGGVCFAGLPGITETPNVHREGETSGLPPCSASPWWRMFG